MKYADGQEVIKGDRVQLGDDKHGIVVCSIDRNEYCREGIAQGQIYFSKQLTGNAYFV